MAKTTKKSASKPRARELINTGTDKRYVRRNNAGQFKDVVDVGLSLAADRRSKSTTKVAPGQGDKGDVVRNAAARAKANKASASKKIVTKKTAPKKTASKAGGAAAGSKGRSSKSTTAAAKPKARAKR